MTTLSYLPEHQVIRVRAADQPPGGRDLWLRVREMPLDLHCDAATGRWWLWAKGTEITAYGQRIGEVAIRVWLSALPVHGPKRPSLPDCAVCDPFTRWVCAPARAALLTQFRGDRDGLTFHLAKVLWAIRWSDTGETPKETYDRIMGWLSDDEACVALDDDVVKPELDQAERDPALSTESAWPPRPSPRSVRRRTPR